MHSSPVLSSISASLRLSLSHTHCILPNLNVQKCCLESNCRLRTTLLFGTSSACIATRDKHNNRWQHLIPCISTHNSSIPYQAPAPTVGTEARVDVG